MTRSPIPFSGKLAFAGATAENQPTRPPLHRSKVRRSNWLLMGDDPNRTVRAGRRRRSDGDPAQRERAEAPQPRDTPPSGGSGGSGSSGGGGGGGWRPSGGSGGGFNIPGGTRGAAGGGMSLLIICLIVAFFLLSNRGGNDSGTTDQQGGQLNQGPVATESAGGLLGQLAATDAPAPTLAPVATAKATARPKATATTAAQSGQSGAGASAGTQTGQTWTVMLYQDADDKILEEDVFVDFNEAERVGSTDKVKVVAQLDRYKGGFSGDGNWTSTRRYEINKDQDLNRINSKLISEGEVNMSSGDTLVDFVTWAAQTYPADKYVLILSDHGMGWPGGWSDPDPGRQGQQVDRKIPLESAIGDNLFLNELDTALAKAQQQTGISQFELIGLDACLMGHIEVMDALAPHARYAVFSQETEPALGWAYTAFLDQLTKNPDEDGATLSKNIVQSYIDQDQRIVDDQARTEWTGSRSSAQAVKNELSRDITLTAVDLSQTSNLIQNLNQLAFNMQQADPKAVAKARRYTQSFTSIFGQDVPPSYIDLGHFLVLLTQATNDAGVNQAARNLAQTLTQTVIAKKSGSDKPGATGISIYFPAGNLYQTAAAGPKSYTAIANRFAQDSLWDEFLAFYYGGATFQEDTRAVTVAPRGVTRMPGSDKITLSPVQKDKSQVAIRDTVLLSTNVSSADNVGYVYFFTGYLDRSSNSIFMIDRDYLEAPNTKEAGGVYYPDWGQGAFKLEFEWEPLAYAITDGQTRAQAALMPESYGRDYTETVYTLDGLYTYQDGEQRYARAYFRDGLLRKVMGFNQQGDNPGAPWEITTTPGDKFTVYETWLEPDGQGGLKTGQQEGTTLTFRNDQPFEWIELDAAAGEYVVGFIVADLEGNTTEAYTTVTVLP